MKKIVRILINFSNDLKLTIVRYPVILVSLIFIVGVNYILIGNHNSVERQLFMRLIYAGIFTAFLSFCIQFACERFERLSRINLFLQIGVLAAGVIYFYLMTSSESLGFTVTIRLFVCCFALFALSLFFPSVNEGADFNKISLMHFKSVFTALLYGIILYLGLLAIYFAIDLLLVKLNTDIPAHLANFVFILFTPTIYLSLLPKFNSKDEVDQFKDEQNSHYPQFLAILISYIAMPLIAAYTAVLTAYFLKILFTLNWPVGQIGPMVLYYSAIGLFVYILSGQLINRIAVLYRKYFPFAQFALVCLQLISVYIRLKAYGITESRYYVTLFGIFSILCSLYLILSKVKKPSMIALLAACFAIFSIMPPIDAFSLSRLSQTYRIEEILTRNDMLINDKIVPKSNIVIDDKREITSIIFYMHNMGHLDKSVWISEKDRKELYNSFERIFGFTPVYGYEQSAQNPKYINAWLNDDAVMDISGYQVLLRMQFDSNKPITEESTSFDLAGRHYFIKQNYKGNNEIYFSVIDDANQSIIDISLKSLINEIGQGGSDKVSLPAKEMTLDVLDDKMKIRVIIENINMEISTADKISYVNGSAFILIAQP